MLKYPLIKEEIIIKEARGLWPRAIKDAGSAVAAWQNISQHSKRFSWGSLEWAAALCLCLTYINCHPTAVNVELSTMEYPDGLNKVNKCSLLLKAVYINFQYFMWWSLYCVTSKLLSSILCLQNIFVNYCCQCVKIAVWKCSYCTCCGPLKQQEMDYCMLIANSPIFFIIPPSGFHIQVLLHKCPSQPHQSSTSQPEAGYCWIVFFFLWHKFIRWNIAYAWRRK